MSEPSNAFRVFLVHHTCAGQTFSIQYFFWYQLSQAAMVTGMPRSFPATSISLLYHSVCSFMKAILVSPAFAPAPGLDYGESWHVLGKRFLEDSTGEPVAAWVGITVSLRVKKPPLAATIRIHIF